MPDEPVFVQSGCHIGQRVNAALFADSVDTSFSHIGTAQNLTATGLEVPALRQASRWKSSRMPARYTEGQAAARWPGITRSLAGDPDSPQAVVFLASIGDVIVGV